MSKQEIAFDPVAPTTGKTRPPHPKSRTSRLIGLLLQKDGTTFDEIRKELNKDRKRKRLTDREVRAWVARSFLAPRGIGVKSRVVNGEMRLFGTQYEPKAVGRKSKPKAKTKTKAKAKDKARAETKAEAKAKSPAQAAA